MQNTFRQVFGSRHLAWGYAFAFLSPSDPMWLFIGNKRGLFHQKQPGYVLPGEEIGERKHVTVLKEKWRP